MTAMPGSVTPTVSDARRVARFGRTERTLHWVHATAFFAMLATGLVLYLPVLAQVVSNRPLMKAMHLVAATAWLTALLLVAVLGNRRALGRTRRELERFDADDLRWLRGAPCPRGASTPARRRTRSSRPRSRSCSSSPARCCGSASATRRCACRARSRCTTWPCTSPSARDGPHLHGLRRTHPPVAGGHAARHRARGVRRGAPREVDARRPGPGRRARVRTTARGDSAARRAWRSPPPSSPPGSPARRCSSATCSRRTATRRRRRRRSSRRDSRARTGRCPLPGPVRSARSWSSAAASDGCG